MTGDRERGLAGLTTYYQKAGLQFQGISFDQLQAYYDQVSPNFIDSLGGSIRLSGLSPQEIDSALAGVANSNFGNVPDYRDFLPALIDQINGVSHTLKITEEGIVTGVKQAGQVVATVGAVGAGAYLAFLAVPLVLMLLDRRTA